MSDRATASAGELSIVVGNYPHTRPLKDGRVRSSRIEMKFIEAYDPVHHAFDAMVEEQAFDVSELAIGAFFQARVAEKPLRLLPVVVSGAFRHGSIWCLRDA